MKQNRKLLSLMMRAVDSFSMLDGARGVLVGFSGGADSAALLRLMKQLCEVRGIYLAALHVHHGIRGDEADRDARFCENECKKLGVDFTVSHFDVPAMAQKLGKGIEETARICRYEAFVRKVCSDSRLDRIATAHNADDNAESVLLDLARGCAADGLRGIPPVRIESGITVIRPLILAQKAEITEYLSSIGADFIFDSTNNDKAYRRNYIRHEIMPAFKEMNPSFTKAVERMNKSLRRDGDYLEEQTMRFLEKERRGDGISLEALSRVHEAIAYRAVIKLYGEVSGSTLETVHADAVMALAKTARDGSSVSLPQGMCAVIDTGCLRIKSAERFITKELYQRIVPGENRFDDRGFAIVATDDGDCLAGLQKYNETLQNIYKLSIYTRLNFAKINGTLFVRSRRDGDAYVFGGMTRKLKKLYNDRKLPISLRNALPILCDDTGIVWVPGFPVADRVKGANGGGALVYYYNNGE